jgi:hypothetical protein
MTASDKSNEISGHGSRGLAGQGNPQGFAPFGSRNGMMPAFLRQRHAQRTSNISTGHATGHV